MSCSAILSAAAAAADAACLDAIRDAVVAGLPAGRRTLLAVSGGIDSMTLLAAACDHAPDRVAGIATFDHGTGPAAAAAAALVAREARARGVPVIGGAAALPEASEAGWRAARWAFLRRAARESGATAVATAHTRDDQVETVAMRLLRDASARGLAGLQAPAPDIVRPFLDVPRQAIERYARVRGVRWMEDPSNASRRHLRNRVRLELLPALRAVDPGIDEALVAVGRRAAAWRADVERFVDRELSLRPHDDGSLHVATRTVVGYDAEELAVLLPAIAARANVRLDRRGTVRLVAFTMRVAAGVVAAGAEIQLSGAVVVKAGRGEIVIRPGGSRATAAHAVIGSDEVAKVSAAGEAVLGGWRLRRGEGADLRWSAWLPADRPLTVRAWRAGDRMRAPGAQAARRVKRFLAEARVPARSRTGWPVVLAGEEIVWIPGVRRSDAATDRPGRPGVHFVCERIDD